MTHPLGSTFFKEVHLQRRPNLAERRLFRSVRSSHGDKFHGLSPLCMHVYVAGTFTSDHLPPLYLPLSSRFYRLSAGLKFRPLEPVSDIRDNTIDDQHSWSCGFFSPFFFTILPVENRRKKISGRQLSFFLTTDQRITPILYYFL